MIGFAATAALVVALTPIELPPPPPLPPPRSVTFTAAGGLHRQPIPELDAVYDKAFPLEVELRGAALFDQRVGVGVVVGFQHRTGEGFAPKAPLPTTVLWQIPFAVEGRLRLVLNEQQPFIPTLRGGLGAVGAIERWDVEGGESGVWRGVKAAVHIAGGFELRIPFPEYGFGGPAFTTGPAIRDVYLSVEGRLRSAADFGRDGLDLSGAAVLVGLTLLL